MFGYKEKVGYRYRFDPNKCRECKGRCCSGSSGYIWITDDEQMLISNYLNIDIDDFKKDYLRNYNSRYSIKEIKINGNYYCVFYDIDNNCCSIYSLRPQQCRDFPFWEYYKNRTEDLKAECPGII